ncbi:hypothetical protein GQF56_13950 [Rhodobacter sphaeroides]|uniref:Gene transfer agent family protein n=2 Tax=Cereibacter sphaeroides TaxID=1063 RepID=Q3J602_CERS4|nr:hypothetical protein RSP_1638 [Cereibacter sphaeroides 2.4.1]AXC62782.1 hypothetical protein DQL45_01130 [Cereibacter sphaeroides 2.4.1]MVX48971.1 hypothetical protein [Cereibacter sphaeroides]GEM95364.1 hypothetical protein RSP03_44310 [Cereibacter sphaeroides]
MIRGAIPFEAEGRARFLRLTTNAQVRYQERAGETLVDAIVAMQGEASQGDMLRLRRLIWAGMGHEGLSEDAAGDLIDEIGLAEASRLLGDAIRAAFPEAARAEAEAPEGNAPAPARAKAKPAAA